MTSEYLNRPPKSLEDQLYEAELELAKEKARFPVDAHRITVLAMHCNALQDMIKARAKR